MPDDDHRDIFKAQIEATTAAICILVRCLEKNGMLEPGQYPDALGDHMETDMKAMSPLGLAVLADIRESFRH